MAGYKTICANVYCEMRVVFEHAQKVGKAENIPLIIKILIYC